MSHNGIGYVHMQLIAEVYDCLENIMGISNDDMARRFAMWNEGEYSSYMIEITAKCLAKQDDVACFVSVIDYIKIEENGGYHLFFTSSQDRQSDEKILPVWYGNNVLSQTKLFLTANEICYCN